jgi:REP element-mobilizing transposase RayT
MKKDTQPMEAEKFYHVYNRGIDGCRIFTKHEHYIKFLEKCKHHLSPFVDTYAYCLMGNHFHLLVRTKSEKEIFEFAPYLSKKKIAHVLASQFGHLCNGYSQYFSRNIDRTGGLFENPFRRKEVDNAAYFQQLIYYIHSNPKKHGIRNDFENYLYSSYDAHLDTRNTKLKRETVLNWFNEKDNYKDFHSKEQDLKEIEHLKIEFDDDF